MLLNEIEIDKLIKKDKILKNVAQILNVDEKDLIKVIERFQKEIKNMESNLD